MLEEITDVKVEAVVNELKNVYDPDLGINIIDLGLVYNVKHELPKVTVEMTLTSPGCPYGPMIMANVRDRVESMEGVEECIVQIVWEPMWSIDKVSEDVRLDMGIDY